MRRTLRRFVIRLVHAVARRRDEERLREEIEAHLALQTEANRRAGMSPVEARRQARLRRKRWASRQDVAVRAPRYIARQEHR